MSDYAAISDDVAAGLAATLRDAAGQLGAEMRAVAISAVPGEEDRLALQHVLGDAVGSDADGAVGTSVEDVIESIARCRVVVTGSYHAAVFALAMGVPAIGLAASRYYEDKFLGLAEQFGPGFDVVLLSGPTAGADLGDLVVAAWRRAPDTRPSLQVAAQRQVDLGHAAYDRIRRLVGTPPGGPVPSGCHREVRG
jgi:colanic acid/amylovoran biosynthesis protein